MKLVRLKHKFAKRYALLRVSGLVVGVMGVGFFVAAPQVLAVGCYSGQSQVSCPSGAVDNNGQTLDTANNCYQQEQGPTQPGQSLPWAQVACSDLTTPVSTASASSTSSAGSAPGKYYCGDPATGNAVTTSIDLGCSHKGNPIMDMLFAFIRILSDGVGVILILSLIITGLMYMTSRGSPDATEKMLLRIWHLVIGIGVYALAYAILNYVVPVTFLGK